MAEGELKVRRRTRLRDKEAKVLRDQLASALGGISPWDETAQVEEGELLDTKVIVVDNQILGLYDGDSPFLTVKGLHKHPPAARYVTVDMGAVRFVTNGADVMAPGIVEADPALKEGDWCWIRDERNKKALAVGRCIVPGATMVRGKGKAVRSIHWLGDKLWNLEA